MRARSMSMSPLTASSSKFRSHRSNSNERHISHPSEPGVRAAPGKMGYRQSHKSRIPAAVQQQLFVAFT